MDYGNKAVDGGNLILSLLEKEKLINKYPKANKFIRPIFGGDEFIKGKAIFCLWIANEELNLAKRIPEIARRIKLVKEMRLKSKDKGANELATRAHQFRDIKEASNNLLIVPCTSSVRREYLPVGFLDNENFLPIKLYLT